MSYPEISLNNPLQDRSIPFTIAFDESAQRTTATPFGVVVELDGCLTTGEIGGPGLPSFTLNVALPPLTKATGVEATVLRTTPLVAEPVLVAPVQLPRSADRNIKPSLQRLPSRPPAGAAAAFVPPRAHLYDRAMAQPRPIARLLRTEISELLSVATLEINPVRLTKERRLEFYPQILFNLTYVAVDRSATIKPVRSATQAERIAELAGTSVINPALVDDLHRKFAAPQPPPQQVDYLILTDNQTWDAAKCTPTGTAGNLTGIFQGLADWKSKRGLKTKVVTVSDLVKGVIVPTNGVPFSTCENGLPARDLQEIIRNFVKWAHLKWNVAWFLLGGNPTIIPTGKANSVGWLDGFGIAQGVTDPPEDKQSYWTGAFLKVKTSLAPHTDSQYALLARADTGEIIPYDPTGKAPKGWYYTDDTYGTEVGLPASLSNKDWTTVYLRVNWPAADKNELTDLNWLLAWADAATDFYYSSLLGPSYDLPGKHDWYLVENGLMGKTTNSSDPDGIQYSADVSVGRAPVANEAEATNFVNKVITYEQFRGPDGTILDPAWPEEFALLATTLCERSYVEPGTTNPPDKGKYYHSSGSNHTLLRLDAQPQITWELFASVPPDDPRAIPYDTKAATTQHGWFYAKSATDLTPSVDPSGCALATEWILMYSTNASELAPYRYVFDNKRPDDSMNDQETMRKHVALNCPQVDLVTRLYEDSVDLPVADQQSPPVDYITRDRVTTLLTGGKPHLNHGAPHWVAISGHGGTNCTLCAGFGSLLDNLAAKDLQNGPYAFIANAYSCETGNFEVECLGTALINNPKGGAVGYIGHSRECDMGYAQPMQEGFFTALPKAFHLGVLNDSRIVARCTANKKAVSTLNLLGDPEMPVWIGRPDTLDVTHPARVGFGAQTFSVTVNSGGKPVEGALVCLTLDGNTIIGSTDASGKAALAIAPATRGQIEVLVTRVNAIPYKSKVQVGRFLKVTVRPTLVQPGAANPVPVTANVQEEGTPVLNANIALSSPLFWTAQYVTGSDGSVSFQIDPAVMCESHVPIRLQHDPSGSFLQIYGWIGVEASKSGYEPDFATILMGISLPKLVWWRPPLQPLENWLAWPDRLIEQFPEKWRTDPATREAIANTFLALDVLSQVNVMLAKGSDLLTVATILGLSDGKKYNRQAVLQRLDTLSTLVSENLNRLNEKLTPIRLMDREVTPPGVETLVGV